MSGTCPLPRQDLSLDGSSELCLGFGCSLLSAAGMAGSFLLLLPNPVDLLLLASPAGTGSGTGNLRGTDGEKQHQQPEATILLFSGLLGASWLCRRKDSMHCWRTSPAALILKSPTGALFLEFYCGVMDKRLKAAASQQVFLSLSQEGNPGGFPLSQASGGDPWQGHWGQCVACPEGLLVAPGEELEGSLWEGGCCEPPWDGKSVFLLENDARLGILRGLVLMLSSGCDMGQVPEELLGTAGGLRVFGLGEGGWNGISWVRNELLLTTNPGGGGICKPGALSGWSSS